MNVRETEAKWIHFCPKCGSSALETRILAALAEYDSIREQLAAEREVGHNQAVTLGQHIARLEDQLAAAVEALKGWDGYAWKDGKYIDNLQTYFDTALAKIGGK